jgi:hypothetical protein
VMLQLRRLDLRGNPELLGSLGAVSKLTSLEVRDVSSFPNAILNGGLGAPPSPSAVHSDPQQRLVMG